MKKRGLLAAAAVVSLGAVAVGLAPAFAEYP